MEHQRLKYCKPIDRTEFWINSDFLSEDLKFINDNKIDAVVLNHVFDFNLKDLNFLELIPNIKFLWITAYKVVDFDGLRFLKSLKELYINDVPKKQTFDFSENKYLEKLSIGTSSLININNVKTLNLGGCNIKALDFKSIPFLEALSLTHCTGVDDLTFLPSIIKLKSLTLSYIPKMTSINGIQNYKKTLFEFSMINCKKVTDLDLISECNNLKKVIIDNSATLSSATLFKDFNQLEHYVVMGTSFIVDNDLSVLLDKNISHFHVKVGK